MSYAKRGMGAGLMTANQANDAMGWTKAKRRAYWQQREAACSEMGDEGECLAQVARHIPVTIAGLGGSSTPRKLSRTQARRLARARNEGLLGLGTGILTDQLCNRAEYSAGWRTTLNSGLRNASYAAIAGAAAAGAFGAFIGRPLVGAVIGAGLGYGAHIVWTGPFYQSAPAA